MISLGVVKVSDPEDINKQIVRDSINQMQSENIKNKSTKLPDRQYYNPADFSNLQENFGHIQDYYTDLVEILQATPQNDDEEKDLDILMNICFEKLKKPLQKFVLEWPQQTAGFLGTNQKRKDVYELLIDEAKAVISTAVPVNRVNLETVVISLNHILNWLIATVFSYSAGEITQATHPQLYNLEHVQVAVGMQGATISAAQESRWNRLKGKMPFAKSSKENEASYGNYVDNIGGTE